MRIETVMWLLTVLPLALPALALWLIGRQAP